MQKAAILAGDLGPYLSLRNVNHERIGFSALGSREDHWKFQRKRAEVQKLVAYIHRGDTTPRTTEAMILGELRSVFLPVHDHAVRTGAKAI
jgi:hypothetical protein